MHRLILDQSPDYGLTLLILQVRLYLFPDSLSTTISLCGCLGCRNFCFDLVSLRNFLQKENLFEMKLKKNQNYPEFSLKI
jgi:hypothetical protein